MDFKNIKTILLFIVSCFIGNYIYDKYIRVGFTSVYMNVDNICKTSKSATYKIILKDRNVTINDPYKYINGLIADKKDFQSHLKIECTKDNKTFILSTTVGLKTNHDSIGVMNHTNKLHGYMGVWEENNCYFVDKNGSFNACKKGISSGD
jgi:hypothetical protein